MKLSWLVALLFLTNFGSGQVSSGPAPLEDRLANSDVVCVCLVAGPEGKQNGAINSTTTNFYPVNVVTTYKGQAATSLRLVSKDGAFGLENGTRYVLLLKRGVNSTLVITDALSIPQDFPPRESKMGQENSLEDDLDAAIGSMATQKESLLNILDQLHNLSDRSVNVLVRLSLSNDQPVSLLSLSMLLKRGVNGKQLFSLFVKKLSSSQESQWPYFGDLTSHFVSNATEADEPSLEVLATAQRRDLSYAAMQGLRKIGDPATSSFFIRQLDSPDSNVEYLAVISLAEIHKKSGDFAPGMGPFEQNTSKYIMLWKDWYKHEGAKR